MSAVDESFSEKLARFRKARDAYEAARANRELLALADDLERRYPLPPPGRPNLTLIRGGRDATGKL